MKHLAKDKGGKVVDDGDEKVQSLLFTFNQHLRNKYDRYYFCFVGCELGNLVIVIAQLFLTNSFLGREILFLHQDSFTVLRHHHLGERILVNPPRSFSKYN